MSDFEDSDADIEFEPGEGAEKVEDDDEDIEESMTPGITDKILDEEIGDEVAEELINEDEIVPIVQVTTSAKQKIVYGKNRTTSAVMTKYEYVNVLGIRITSIEEGNPPFIEPSPGMTHEDMIKEEIKQKKCPLAILRPVGESLEYWKVSELAILEY